MKDINWWHWWFAWRPVICKGKIVWLERLLRKRWYESYWEYR